MWLLWILSLAASSLLPATGEVVSSFSPCKKSFLNGNPPNLEPGIPARICQRYKNQYRFATMYNRVEHIPMFSAYEFKSGPSGRPTIPWMIEPQLANSSAQANMETEQSSGIPPSLLQNSQAVLSDYANANPYIMGHLSPVCHHKFKVQKESTFTLTNVVPLDSTLNNGKWKSYELNIKNKYTKGCLHTYIIVGAVPGNRTLNNKKRVNIPSHMWAAVCCQLPQRKTKSKGVIAVNNQNNRIREISLNQLESALNRHYGKTNINLFNGAC